MSLMKRTVIVRHPETLGGHALVEGSEVPEWAADLVHADDTDAKAPAKVEAPVKVEAPAKAPAKPDTK